ncbi:UNVERIFIED_CONTAM: mandelate racemase/muconate lactonizing enzyme family protein [Microbacterium sp. SLM126]
MIQATSHESIVAAQAWLIDLEVETVRTDAIQSFIKQETIFVQIDTADGLTGLGYSYTIGTGGQSVLSLLQHHLLPRLRGADSRNVEAIWADQFWSTHATAVGAITSLALAAVDTALWDIRSQRAVQPLWQIAGGYRDSVPLYDTEGGWLHLPVEQLVAGAVASRSNGFGGAKLKVGKPSIAEDRARLLAVREAVGPEFHIMVDANQSMTAPEAIRRAAAFEDADLYWFEEPMPADDVNGHARLAAATSIPVAVGESLYSIGQFRDYLHRDAAGIVQVDVARIGGITPWLKVAHLAESYNVAVCPHFLMELHVSLVAAVPNGAYVEHIPQLRSITKSEMRVRDGLALAPTEPGLGIEWDLDEIDRRRVA